MRNKALLALLSFNVWLLSVEPLTCEMPTPCRVELRHREARGVGYEEGYTTAALFVTPNWQRSFQPFVDFRAHLMNDGRFASNAGLGVRYHPDDHGWVYGGNLYYDYRSSLNLSPHQIGLGIEALGRVIDFRLNGYLPVGQNVSQGDVEPGPMTSRTVILQRQATAALPNIQSELGCPLPVKAIDLYFGIGPYYLFSKHVLCDNLGGTLGGQARLTARIFDGVELGLLTTYDRIFHGTFQGYLSLSYPLGAANLRSGGSRWRKQFKGCPSEALMARRKVQDVQRFEIVPINSKRCLYKPINPLTQEPYRLIFVNNTSPYEGDGSYKFPYNTLAQAEANSQENEVIYLLYNNGYTVGVSSGLQLKEGQTFHGSGVDLNLDGQLVLPAITPGLLPTMTGDGVPALTLANNNSVIGINFLNWTHRAIDARASANFNIRFNDFLNNGVVLGHAIIADGSPSGYKQIVANEFYTNIGGSAAGISDVSLRNISASTLLIANNTFRSIGFGAMNINAQSSSVRIISNDINQASSPAMYITANGNGSKVFFENNFIVSEGGANALIFTSRNGSVSFDMRNNDFVNDSTHHIQMFVGPIVTDTANVKALFQNNRLASQGLAQDAFVLGASSSSLCLQLNENVSDGAFLLQNGTTASSYQVASSTGTAQGVSEQNHDATIIFSPTIADFTFVGLGTCE